MCALAACLDHSCEMQLENGTNDVQTLPNVQKRSERFALLCKRCARRRMSYGREHIKRAHFKSRHELTGDPNNVRTPRTVAESTTVLNSS